LFLGLSIIRFFWFVIVDLITPWPVANATGQGRIHHFCAAGTPNRNFWLLPARRVVFNSSMSQTHPLTTTTFELPGYRITKSFGVVRGIMVRSRSVIGNVGASIQAIFGGNISLYTNLCERAREDTFNQMLTHAGELGANAVVGVRYDATEIAPGITEVLCYGTAVFVEAA
jgi:uncharacterized protein YbjQ (UPF0145 family)